VLFIPFYLWVLPGMGFLAQHSLFWLFLERKLPRDPSGVDSVRYSVMRISVGGWFHVVGWNGYVTYLGCLVEGYS